MFNFLKKTKSLIIEMPFDGEVVDLSQVPDQVFSQKMLGDGFAIIPSKGVNTVKAPCDGEVVQIFPTNHAIGMKTKDGIEMIIHIGIDTVELKGEGFERLVTPPCEVKQGAELLKFDTTILEGRGKQIITPIVFTEMMPIKQIKPSLGTHKQGEPVCEVVLK